MIISHFNACNNAGLSWVDEVLMKGLKQGDKNCDWRIEVHSSDDENIEVASACSEDDKSSDEHDYGPAVYVIHKAAISEDELKKRIEADQEECKVALKYFGY